MLFFQAEPQSIFCKDSARREQEKRESQWIFFFHAEPQPIFCKDMKKFSNCLRIIFEKQRFEAI